MIIEEKDIKIVKNILKKIVPDYEVWAFGSRISEKNLRKFSDLDLVIIDNKPLNIELFLKLKEEFSNSDLPFKVDVLEWSKIDENFKAIILKNYEIVQK